MAPNKGQPELDLVVVAAHHGEILSHYAKVVGPGTYMDTLNAQWERGREDYWKPVVSITGSLPKDEIAAMAEALVNLTKFRRRVTTDRETVGGPIDVAVISKGDGFVWVKRKHYFSAEYNPRVVARYEQGG